jgi:antitoxin HicB
METKLSFRVILRPEPEGGYTVIVPSLPGCVTYGETEEEASRMAEDAVRAYIESMRKHGEEVVDDSKTTEKLLTV